MIISTRGQTVADLYLSWSQTADNKCPVCCTANKKTSHVLICPEVNAIKLFTTKLMKELTSTLDTNKTCPAIKALILDILKNHRHQKAHLIQRRPSNQLVQNTIHHKRTIDWTNFVLGQWSPLW